MRIPPEALADKSEKAEKTFTEFAGAIHQKDFAKYVEFLPTFAFLQFDHSGNSRNAGIHKYEAHKVKEL